MLPDFFLVGAARSATTTTFEALRTHSQINMPAIKEPQYFSYNPDRPGFNPGNGPGDKGETIWTKTKSKYKKYFKQKNTLHGDASVSYLYSPDAPKKIADCVPDAKIIIQLRHPVDRAYSHYKQLVRDGRETKSFKKAINEEENRIEKNWEWAWHYKHVGQYAEQVKRYKKYFPDEQIRIVRFDDYVLNTKKVIHNHIAFLNLEEENITIKPYNISGDIYSRKLARWLFRWGDSVDGTLQSISPTDLPDQLIDVLKKGVRGLRRLNRKSKSAEPIDSSLYNNLLSHFSNDIKKLNSLTNLHFNDWLNRKNIQ